MMCWKALQTWMIIIDGEWNRMHESQPPTVQAQYSANPNVGLDWDIQPRINAILFINICYGYIAHHLPFRRLNP